MTNEYKTLIGFKGNIIDLSNELQEMGFEDICYLLKYGDMQEILENGDMAVSTDECQKKHIQILFEVLEVATSDEIIEATTIEITKVKEYL